MVLGIVLNRIIDKNINVIASVVSAIHLSAPILLNEVLQFMLFR